MSAGLVSDLSLRDPTLLWLGLLVPLALVAGRMRGAPAVPFAPAPLLAGPSSSSWRTRTAWVPLGLQVVGLLLAVIALARPVYQRLLPPETEGIDIILCLDVSSSMEARDLDPQRTRLDLARDAAARFAAERPHDRIGLLTFARYPDVRCPLTLDHGALADVLASVTTVENEGPEDATGIGTAVARAAQILGAAAGTSPVVVLLTDGEENVASRHTPGEIAPLHAAQLCAEFGVRVYTIAAGIGRPVVAGGWEPIDTRQVRRLAERTGGVFFEARDAGAVSAVYERIAALETAPVGEVRYQVEERFAPFLLAALVVVLFAGVLGATVWGILP